MADGNGPKLNRIHGLLKAGKPVTLALVTMPGTAAIQVWAGAGIDMLIIDMEHGPIDIESAHAMIAATAGTGAVPLVRVPWNVPWLVKPLLDAGAMGICFPMIANAADAEAAVRSMRYPPDGERGWGPFYAPLRWNVPMPQYVESANDEMFTLLLIERPEAIDNLDEIMQVPGIDMFAIAPFDLATLLGHPTNPAHPDVAAVIARAEEKLLAGDVPLSGVALTPERANELIAKGYQGIVIGFDWMLMQRAAKVMLDGINREG